MSPSAQAVEAAEEITAAILCNRVLVRNRIKPDQDFLPTVTAIIDRAYSAKLAAMRGLEPYLGHWPNCESAERHPCNCGYEQALAAYAATETNEES